MGNMDTDSAENAEVFPSVSETECDQEESSVTENPSGAYYLRLY